MTKEIKKLAIIVEIDNNYYQLYLDDNTMSNITNALPIFFENCVVKILDKKLNLTLE